MNAENSGTHVTRKPYISMDCDEDGHPQLPAREEWPGRTQDRKAVIRAFVATAYRESLAVDLDNSCPQSVNVQGELLAARNRSYLG